MGAAVFFSLRLFLSPGLLRPLCRRWYHIHYLLLYPCSSPSTFCLTHDHAVPLRQIPTLLRVVETYVISDNCCSSPSEYSGLNKEIRWSEIRDQRVNYTS